MSRANRTDGEAVAVSEKESLSDDLFLRGEGSVIPPAPSRLSLMLGRATAATSFTTHLARLEETVARSHRSPFVRVDRDGTSVVI